MASPTTKTKETSTITPRQKFEGHTKYVRGAISLPGGEQMITCSYDGSLRVWNLKSGKQIGEDWRDGKTAVYRMALSPDGKKVVSGSQDGTVKLWDIDTCKLIAKWTGHKNQVLSVCWSRDGRRVLSGSGDGTARQWDVEKGETILTPIKTGHCEVWAAVYSPNMTMFATGGFDGVRDSPIKIWDSKTGELAATLKGHTDFVNCLAWTPNGKTLISASFDHSIRTWDTETRKQLQVVVLDELTSIVWGIAISPNGRILASASQDKTVRLWNLNNGQPIGSPLHHAHEVHCTSFSADGKLLATGCNDKNAYTWDVAAIMKGAGLDNLLSDPKANKSALRAHNATRRPVQQRPPAYRVPQGFFDGVPGGHSNISEGTRAHSSSAPQGSTLLSRLFHRSPSDARDTSPSSPLDWARNLLKRRGQSGGGVELQGPSSAVVEVPYAKGKRRNASAREKRKTKPLRKTTTASSSRPPKLNVTLQSGAATLAQPSSQPQTAVSSSSSTAATTSTPSPPQAIINHPGLWTRFWLFIGCISTKYTDDCH